MLLFYDLLQVALGEKEKLSYTPSDNEWEELFITSQKQAVTGFVFEALDRLSQNKQKIPAALLFKWIGVSEQIRQQNILFNSRIVELGKHFEKDNFKSCILKGQGNAILYPNPLSRTPGDIDIWLDGDKETIISYVKNQYPTADNNGIHLDYPIYDDIEVEVHYRPQYMACRKYDRRIGAFFQKEAPLQFANIKELPGGEGKIAVPLPYFNLIQQLAHLLGHFYAGGIGFRHLIDLYYVLRNIKSDDRNYKELLDDFGLLSFAEGVMWVEKTILGLDESYLVAEPSETKGKLVLREIERGGNFGFYDKRNEIRRKGVLIRAVMDSYRLFQLISIQPSEAIKRLQWKLSNVESMKRVLNVG